MKLHYLLFGALALPAAAFADASAGGNFDVPTFTIVDLDENDGVTPTITFSDQTTSLYASASKSQNFYCVLCDSRSESSADWTSPISTQADVPNARAVVESNVTPGQVRLHGTSMPVSGNPGVTSDAFANISFGSQFVLHGKGLVIVTLPYTFLLAGDFGQGDPFAVGWNAELRESARLWANAYYDNAGGLHYANLSRECVNADGALGCDDGADTLGGMLTLTLSNFSDMTDAVGSFYFGGSVETRVMASVPEPETYAFLLSGLLLVGGAHRLRVASRPA